MNRRLVKVALALLVVVSPLWAEPPLPEAPPATEVTPSPAGESPVDGPSGHERVWVEADFLLWSMRGASLPPLVTTSPQGTPIAQAGVLGRPSGLVLFGSSSRFNDDLRAGGRVAAGYWFDDAEGIGVEADFFMLQDKATHFNWTSRDGILARPFIDANSGRPASERIAFPGDTNGSVQVFDGTNGLVGAGVLVRGNVWCGHGIRLDLLGGYRYLGFSDHLGVSEELTNVNPNNPNFIPVGTHIVLGDRFDTRNDLHALDLGLAGQWRCGRFSLDLRTRLAIGDVRQMVDINGGTTVTVPGVEPVSNAGGLLALQSNIGHHSRDDLAIAPQLDLKLGYQLTPSLRVSVGYSFLFWNDVVRAGNQIDPVVNSSLIPPVTAPSGPLHPAFAFHRTSLWAQGIEFDLEYRY